MLHHNVWCSLRYRRIGRICWVSAPTIDLIVAIYQASWSPYNILIFLRLLIQGTVKKVNTTFVHFRFLNQHHKIYLRTQSVFLTRLLFFPNIWTTHGKEKRRSKSSRYLTNIKKEKPIQSSNQLNERLQLALSEFNSTVVALFYIQTKWKKKLWSSNYKALLHWDTMVARLVLHVLMMLRLILNK